MIAKDVETYFKDAQHPLPANSGMTLTNAKNAGYLESAGSGQFKLNPVGHNLVVHTLPRTSVQRTSSRSSAKKQKSNRK
jgi:hypothetical protein